MTVQGVDRKDNGKEGSNLVRDLEAATEELAIVDSLRVAMNIHLLWVSWLFAREKKSLPCKGGGLYG